MSKGNVLHHISDHELRALIDKRESFTITRVTNFKQTVKKIEQIIEQNGATCRIYTAGRAATMAISLIPSPALLFGLASAVAITAHNIATRNPDYEIAKFPLSDTIVVNYNK